MSALDDELMKLPIEVRKRVTTAEQVVVTHDVVRVFKFFVWRITVEKKT